MTRAPWAVAISRVPSVEPASTTSTSVTSALGISSSTRAIEPASLYVGMTTLTRIPGRLPQSPARIAAREQRVDAGGAPGPRPGEAAGDDDGRAQLPHPGVAELREPQGEEEGAGGGRDRAGGGARQKEHAEAELGHGRERGGDPRIGRSGR